MSRKGKLDTMHQAHGKAENFQPTTLDQIWGDTGTSKYGTMDKVVYEQQLQEMNKADLQAHATKVGLVPVDDRNRLIKRLLHEFTLHVDAYRHPSAPAKAPVVVSSEVAKILAEGR